MKSQKIFSQTISLDELEINYSNVLAEIGYKDEESAEHIKPMLDELILEVGKYVHVQAGYRIIDEFPVQVDNEKIFFGENTFHSGRIINSQLKKINCFALFVASIGSKFDLWCANLFDENPAEGFLADTLGSTIVESAADWIEAKLNRDILSSNLRCTNRFSPGYCEWHLSEQQKIFSLLPKKFCGIELTESSLMKPRKSVSGIIGIGENVVKKDYQCKICEMENCYKRKAEFEKETSQE